MVKEPEDSKSSGFTNKEKLPKDSISKCEKGQIQWSCIIFVIANTQTHRNKFKNAFFDDMSDYL